MCDVCRGDGVTTTASAEKPTRSTHLVVVSDNTQAMLAAHQDAISAFARARTVVEVVTVLEELATLQRAGIDFVREIEAQVLEYGQPSPLSSLLDVLRQDYDRVARGFALVATSLDRMRRNVLAGSWSVEGVRDVLHTQAQQGDLYFEELRTLNDRLLLLGPRLANYFEAAFARVEADPAWIERLAATRAPDGTFTGTALSDVPDDDIDG